MNKTIFELSYNFNVGFNENTFSSYTFRMIETNIEIIIKETHKNEMNNILFGKHFQFEKKKRKSRQNNATTTTTTKLRKRFYSVELLAKLSTIVIFRYRKIAFVL